MKRVESIYARLKLVKRSGWTSTPVAIVAVTAVVAFVVVIGVVASVVI